MQAYEDLRSSPPNETSRFAELLSPASRANPQPLLTDVETFSPTLDYMLELFLRPSGPRNITTEISPSYGASTTPSDAIELERRTTQSARYRALIFSTGAHFSSRHFNLPSTAAHLEFFDLVVSTFLDKVAEALEKASEHEKRDKEVIVRPTSNGHDDCHAAKGPLKDVDRNKSSKYSWNDMWDMNDRAEVSSGGDDFRSCGGPGSALIFLRRPGSRTKACASASIMARHHAPFDSPSGCCKSNLSSLSFSSCA